MSRKRKIETILYNADNYPKNIWIEIDNKSETKDLPILKESHTVPESSEFNHKIESKKIEKILIKKNEYMSSPIFKLWCYNIFKNNYENNNKIGLIAYKEESFEDKQIYNVNTIIIDSEYQNYGICKNVIMPWLYKNLISRSSILSFSDIVSYEAFKCYIHPCLYNSDLLKTNYLYRPNPLRQGYKEGSSIKKKSRKKGRKKKRLTKRRRAGKSSRTR